MVKTSTSIFDFLSITATKDQSKALYELEGFLQEPSENRAFVLTGSAGTGKTTLMKCLKDYLENIEIPFELLAPTAKAASILKRRTNWPAHTLHHLIYLPEQLEDGRVILNYRENETDGRTIYIVDEASMIQAENASSNEFISQRPLLIDLLNYVFSGNPENQIIFLGDTYQLNPVFEKQSPSLSAERLNSQFGLSAIQVTLREVVRQASDSPVLRLANQIKNLKDTNRSLYSLRPERLSSESQAIAYFLTYFDIENLEEIVMICKSNEQVEDMNHKIREGLSFGNRILAVGDAVMLRANWMKGGIQLVNGETGVIRSISTDIESRAGLKFTEAEIEFETDGEKRRIKSKIFIDSLTNPKGQISGEDLKNLKGDRMRFNAQYRQSQMAKDDEYMNAMRLSYAYAITCHKAQGSEWERVIFSPKIRPVDYEHLYTAITRAKNEVVTWWF
jgi:exodeoxyribonuclease-5